MSCESTNLQIFFLFVRAGVGCEKGIPEEGHRFKYSYWQSEGEGGNQQGKQDGGGTRHRGGEVAGYEMMDRRMSRRSCGDQNIHQQAEGTEHRYSLLACAQLSHRVIRQDRKQGTKKRHSVSGCRHHYTFAVKSYQSDDGCGAVRVLNYRSRSQLGTIDKP